MALYPDLEKTRVRLKFRQCSKCGRALDENYFIQTNNFFYGDGYLPICTDCIEEYFKQTKEEDLFAATDKICQYAGIPFIPSQVIKLYEMNGANFFPIYNAIFLEQEYEGIDWEEYNKEYLRLKKLDVLDEQIPLIKEEKRKKLKKKWGANYDDAALAYLENLYTGMLTTQNVNGVLQGDQVLKICKISYELDCRIREGEDFDKILASYDKLVKIGEFTPKNVKNINDFDTMGELIKWFEKRGWKNKFYDSVTRDVVDETLKNIQNFNQRLYTNETGIADEISRRIEALKSAKELEDNQSIYGLDSEYDLEEYDNEGYAALMKDNEEFKIDIE
jgi:hypothetical protein